MSVDLSDGRGAACDGASHVVALHELPAKRRADKNHNQQRQICQAQQAGVSAEQQEQVALQTLWITNNFGAGSWVCAGALSSQERVTCKNVCNTLSHLEAQGIRRSAWHEDATPHPSTNSLESCGYVHCNQGTDVDRQKQAERGFEARDFRLRVA